MYNIYVEKFNKIGYITVYSLNNKITGINFGKNELSYNYNKKKPENVVKRFFNILELYLDGECVEFNLDYEIITSKFADNVYKELCKIKYGELISYKALAARVNNSKAYRAVGMACKNNPLPLLIPCHRVIRENGDIGGFTGGINLKKFLINLEKGV